MRVGITYDLRDDYLEEGYSEEDTAEFDRKDTIDHIESTLRALGYETDRIGHVRALAKRLCADERWDIVFNIAEGMFGLAREAQVPALLDAYQIPYTFGDGVVMALTLHKAFTKRVLRDAGLPTPDFAVVSSVEDIARIELPLPLFVKPLAEGTGKGVTPSSCIRSTDELDRECRDLLTKYNQPVLVERFLPGREFTVGIIGSGARAEALGTLEVVLLPEAEKDVYSYVNKERCEELIKYVLITDREIDDKASKLALQAWAVLDARDAGRIDLRMDEYGELQLLEINPLAGIHPEHSDLPILATQTGMKYVDLIDRIMRSALERAGLEPPGRKERL